MSSLEDDTPLSTYYDRPHAGKTRVSGRNNERKPRATPTETSPPPAPKARAAKGPNASSTKLKKRKGKEVVPDSQSEIPNNPFTTPHTIPRPTIPKAVDAVTAAILKAFPISEASFFRTLY
jgi:hypothetical protein